MSKKLTTSDIVILISGVVLLVASFIPWIEFDFGFGSESENAWSTFPAFVYPAIAGTIAAAHVALTKLTGTSVPDRVAGFTWTQIHLVLGLWATLTMLGVALIDTEADKAIGLWLSFIAAIALLVGAIMRDREPAESTTETPAAG